MRSNTPPPGGTLPYHPKSPPERQKLLMESLLVVKMEQMETNIKPFVRTDSVDSTGSMSSATSIASNVCKCDDCLLGIGDLYRENSNKAPVKKNKVYNFYFNHYACLIDMRCVLLTFWILLCMYVCMYICARMQFCGIYIV